MAYHAKEVDSGLLSVVFGRAASQIGHSSRRQGPIMNQGVE